MSKIQGTTETLDFIDAQPSLRDLGNGASLPSDKSLGYFRGVPPGQNSELHFLDLYRLLLGDGSSNHQIFRAFGIALQSLYIVD